MTSSLLASMLSLPAQERASLLATLTDRQAEALLGDWQFWARPEQLPPAWDWTTWLILAGRGFGKTRTGAEWVRQQVDNRSAGRIALIAETQRDLEDVLVFGESGLWSVFPKDQKPVVTRKPVRITFHTGAVALGYNATEPDQLRGPQFDAAWGDELAKWRYAQETYDQLQFGLRLGARPRQMFTTTPRPIPLIRKLIADPTTAVTRGKTMDNRGNLAASFLKQVHDRYAGTRLGRQELDAEILDDTPGALWSRSQIEANRCPLPDLRWVSRIVVAVDPPAVSGDSADACGIVVAVLDRDGTMVVIDDATVQGLTPEKWARAVVETYHRWNASSLVAEVNQGGEMVQAVIRAADPTIPVKMVRATRGKYVRAEPIAALYEQGKVRHAGAFPALEDQMVNFTLAGLPGGGSPDNLDALVWAITELNSASAGIWNAL